MAFRLTENRESRTGTHLPPSETRQYYASGEGNEATVRVYAIANTPAFITDDRGTLYRQDVRISPRGYQMYSVEVPYSPRKRESGNYTISFDTTGGTVHVTTSQATVASYARPNEPAPPDQGGLIGVNGDDVEGTDVTIPALSLQVDFTHPTGIITIAQIKNLARWTGRYNTAPFLTLDAGEVLFLGCSGSEGTETETTVSYKFAASENINGLTFGDIFVTEKRGWDYAWVAYEDHEENGQPAKRPKWVYVEEVYRGINLATALGFGA